MLEPLLACSEAATVHTRLADIHMQVTPTADAGADPNPYCHLPLAPTGTLEP